MVPRLGSHHPRGNRRYSLKAVATSHIGRPLLKEVRAQVRTHAVQQAYAMNGEPLSIAHGAALRLRVERQLGYKQAKYVTRLEVVALLSGVGRGRGGYWEDEVGYDWYAGI